MKNLFKSIIRSLGYNFHKNAIEDFYSYDPLLAFKRDEIKSSYQYFREFFYNSVLLKSQNAIRSYAINKSLENSSKENQDELFLEFGVNKGVGINFFSDHLKASNKIIYGFDSFEGQPIDWPGYFHTKGFQKSDKNTMDKLNSNVEIIDGLVEDTLEPFLLKNENKKINFVHMDLDAYVSSLFVLKKIKPYLSNNAILLFHIVHNYSGWKNGLIKAINETFDKNEFEFIAFSSETQGVIKYKKN
jgi:hypothetical protein